jgi:hypothetical protein
MHLSSECQQGHCIKEVEHVLFSLLDLSEASAGGNSINIVSWPSAGPPAGAAFLEGFAVVPLSLENPSLTTWLFELLCCPLKKVERPFASKILSCCLASD